MIKPLTKSLAKEFGLVTATNKAQPAAPSISTASLTSTEQPVSSDAQMVGKVTPYKVDDINSEHKEAKTDAQVNDAIEPLIIASSNIEAKQEYTYAGDIKDDDFAPLKDDHYQTLEFESPSSLISFYDDGISNGHTVLYKWQRNISKELADAKPDKLKPFKKVVCAANGSGKDAFVITPFAVWFALTKIKSRCIITSSSGVQLTSQTETYIANLCRKVNEVHGEEIFRIRQRFIKCRLTGSEIRLFATDEEGKAEGYHPIDPQAEMAIIINEAKSVKPEIYRALRRCTGYNYWIEVSTPGAPSGDFYVHFNKWPTSQRITYLDCPQHLSEVDRLDDLEELGEHSALYRSKWLALFTSLDTDSIIPLESVNACIEKSNSRTLTIIHKEWPLRVGIDIAAGGAETSIRACQGNCIRNRFDFREKDTTVSATIIDRYLRETLHLNKSYDYIFGDDGGIGKGVIDQLNSNYGWNIKRINNQSPSSDKKRYINRGAENWFKVKRIIEEHLWFFSKEDTLDEKFLNQLTDRRYKQQSTQGRIALESKKDAMANGRPSPDRADAFVLCFTDISILDFKPNTNTNTNTSTDSPASEKQRNLLQGSEAISQWYEDNVTFGNVEIDKPQQGNGRRFDGRISTLVARKSSFSKQNRYVSR